MDRHRYYLLLSSEANPSMAVTASPISITCPNPKYSLFNSNFSITSPTCPAIRLTTATSSSLHKRLLIKCSGNSPQERGPSDSLKDVLSGIVDQQVEQLLNREENRALLDGLVKASQRVEMAKRELAQIERQELEAKQSRNYVNQLETRASQIEESQREISEARALVEEAQRSLLSNVDRDGGEGRLESIKAALISALVGSIAALPISLTQVTSNTQLILPTAITFVSCALFGVTFRYAVRRDLGNFQLKAGTSAAFAFVKGTRWNLIKCKKKAKS
uniref:Uncharacterized protein n=1 Tax=Rhizophora mucronata TaxID=61149 RepID=A0A2P2JN57_RHIMU